jgi:hypothetical protein
MGRMRELLDRLSGRAGNAEADVQADPARADSREPEDGYVGRTGPDDDFAGETGAEIRADDARSAD